MHVCNYNGRRPVFFSFDERLSRITHHRHTERMQSVVVIHPNDGRRREHGVVRVDVGGVFGRLLDGGHFLLAASVVEGAHYDWLAE